MHYLNETHLYIFLVQVILLLGAARGLGELFRRWKQPTITAEILVGIFFGPTILGRLAPGLWIRLFPQEIIQVNMLETVAWIGILFFLLKTGLEIDFSAAWRQRGDALKISLADLTIPMIITFIPCMFLPAHYMGAEGHRLVFALFMATVMTLSALPVTARILNDLNLYKTDVGFLIMSALSVNDIMGWMVFTVLLGFFTDTSVTGLDVAIIVGSTIGFTVFCLAWGRKIADKIIRGIQKKKLPEPGSSITFICLLGMVCGAVTLKIGIHALFGFFIAGIIVGESKVLPQKTRQVISQMVHAIFIPLFFASVGLKIDFLKNFDVFLVVFVLVIGIVARLSAAWIGVTLTGKHKANRYLISLAHVPGGEMQIVVGLLALEYNLISQTVFVAIVFGAIVTSIILGPWMAHALKKRKEINMMEFFVKRAVVPELRATTKDDAIKELSGIISEQENMPSQETVYESVTEREEEISTAVEFGVAFPHGTLNSLTSAVVVLARSKVGIEWDSPDGKLSRLIFMILSPEDSEFQLQIMSSIAGTMMNDKMRQALLSAEGDEEMWELLREDFNAQNIKRRKSV